MTSLDLAVLLLAEGEPPALPIGGLTRGLAAGDEAAFREFHARYFERIYRYVTVLLRGDRDAARDVTQETLLRLVRHVRPFDDEGVFWDWLTRLARTAAADHRRKASRYRKFLELLSLVRPAELAFPAPDETGAALAAALATLPDEDRDLLNAKYRGRESVRDIAARLGLSDEAVASRLARARDRLRESTFRILRHE